MQEELMLETPDQVGALAHPLRLRILSQLFDEDRTNKQVADLLGEPPTRVHFHVRELADNGLIQLVDERPKGGVIEKYYRATARHFRLSPALAGSREAHDLALVNWEAARQVLLHAIERYGGAPPNLVSGQYHARLGSDALRRVQEHLGAIERELRDATRRPADGDGTVVAFGYLFHQTPDGEEGQPG